MDQKLDAPADATVATGIAASPPRRSGAASARVPKWLRALWRRYVIGVLADEERLSRDATQASPPDRIAWKIVGVFVVSAISLTLLEYLGKSQYYWDYVHARGVTQGAMDLLKVEFASRPAYAPIGWHRLTFLATAARDVNSPQAQLAQLLYWAAWCVTAYLLIPALFVVVVLRERLRDYGLRFRGTMQHMWVYGLMFLVVLPLVFFVSGDEGFKLQYPFYRAAARDPLGFVIWELAYAAQFFSLEFFFRGFMVHGLKGRLGPYAVLAMMVPYCMIHFGKPMPETFGAIIAGVVLGVLSLRTGSILLGFLIHVSVALSMDLVSLWRQDQLAAIVRSLF